MANWMLRGLVFAGGMVALRLVQGVLINTFEAQAGLISVALLGLFVIPVAAWGVLDGRADATANPDPDRREDLAMRWLTAGLLAGVASGAVTWIVSLVDKALYVGGLVNELTTFAAFTALLVFLPAMIGVVVGRALIDRQHAKAPQRHHGLAAEGAEQADTDVFAAVSAPTEEFPADADEDTAATAAGEDTAAG